MKDLELVYSDTWHLCLDRPGPPRDRIVRDVELLGSPYRCDFSGLRLPLIDWRVPAIGTVPVRVVVHDDPAFFPLLADADRDYILCLFAHIIVHMIRGNMSRYQYGFSADAVEPGASYVTIDVEYHLALVESLFASDPISPARYVTNIRRGPPPRRFRVSLPLLP